MQRFLIYHFPLVLFQQPIQCRPADPVFPRNRCLALVPCYPVMICTGNIVNLRLFPSLVLALPLGDLDSLTLSFANLFSRLDYICKEKKMTPSDRYAIQTMRRNCNAAMGDRFQADYVRNTYYFLPDIPRYADL